MENLPAHLQLLSAKVIRYFPVIFRKQISAENFSLIVIPNQWIQQ